MFVKQNVQPSFQTKYLVKTNESEVTYATSRFINKLHSSSIKLIQIVLILLPIFPITQIFLFCPEFGLENIGNEQDTGKPVWEMINLTKIMFHFRQPKNVHNERTPI